MPEQVWSDALSACSEVVPAANLKVLTDGKLYHPDFTTVRITFEVPTHSKVDINDIAIVFALPHKGSKIRTVVSSTGAPEYFLKELSTATNSLLAERGFIETVRFIAIDFDSYLLKLWRHLERYQAVESKVTVIRYQIKEHVDVTIDAPSIDRPKKKSLCTVKSVCPASTQAAPSCMSSEQQLNKEPEIATADTPAPQAKPLPKIEVSKKVYTGPKAFLSPEDFCTLDEYHRALEKQSQSLILHTLNTPGTQEALYASTVRPRPHRFDISDMEFNQVTGNFNMPWTEKASADYAAVCTLLHRAHASLESISVNRSHYFKTLNILRLGRYFFDHNFNVLGGHSSYFVCAFNYPFALLSAASLDKIAQCEHFPVLSKIVSAVSGAYIPFTLSIPGSPDTTPIRVNCDVNGELLSLVQSYAKKHSASIIHTRPDIFSTRFSLYLSRNLSSLLEMVPLYHESTAHSSSAGSVSSLELETSISELPSPLCMLPLFPQGSPLRDLYSFFTQLLPDLLGDLMVRAGVLTQEQNIREVLNGPDHEQDTRAELSSSGYSSNDSDATSTSSVDALAAEQNDYDWSVIPAVIVEGFLASDPNEKRPNNDRGTSEDSEDSTPETRKRGGLSLYLRGLDLSGCLVLQIAAPYVACACSKCLKINIVELSVSTGRTLSGSASCAGCGTTMSLVVQTTICNGFSAENAGVRSLTVVSHVSNFPLCLSNYARTGIICQCSSCDTLALHNGWKQVPHHAGVVHLRSYCPMCFAPSSIVLGSSLFCFPNGGTIPLPKLPSVRQTSLKHGAQAIKGPLPDNGGCKHAPHSYRWFRFECGMAYPCDSCHAKQCACGNNLAHIQLCGFCGKESPISTVCPHCKRELTFKRTSHWEGGSGCRNTDTMSRKDNKKYSKVNKTKSKSSLRREAMQKRGNAKKKADDRF